MKVKVLIILISIISGFIGLYCIKRLLLIRENIKVVYDQTIDTLPVNKLKNLRSLNEQEKIDLYQSLDFENRFKSANIIKNIIKIKNPQIIVWFTDHFGQIPIQQVKWYQENIFDPSQSINPVFWLVDLAAWRILTIKQNIGFDNCSLFNEKSEVLTKKIESPQFNILRASNFFSWLQSLPGTIDKIMPTTLESLVRQDLRPGIQRFSLRDIGYAIPFLNIWSTQLNTNIIDADHTQIFPLLQYLEGIYYALEIIKKCMHPECNIVFLLPNKEFTYYMSASEKKPFTLFKNDVTRFLQQENKSMPRVTIHFYPFSFGSSFYDQPFEMDGPYITSDEELLNYLKL